MKRIISVLTVLAIMVAMLAASAMPAFAQIPPPPNCETGQVKAAFNGNNKDPRNFFKHLANAGECLFGFPPGKA